MTNTKSSNSHAGSKSVPGSGKSSRGGGNATVRDIQKTGAPSPANVSKAPRPAFSVKTLKSAQGSNVPLVEPLDDDSDTTSRQRVDVQYGSDVQYGDDYAVQRSPLMRVNSVADDEEEVYENEDAADDAREPMDPFAARDIIRVRFGSFVQLVADHELEEVINRNADQEIIMSSNLLTELASAKDRREEKKVPLVFLVGIAIGVVLTYIFFSG